MERYIDHNINTVYSDPCASYNEEKICEIVSHMITDIISDNGIDVNSKTVLVKPNLLARRAPDKAITTHPAYVYAASKALVKLGASVIIGDSPGGTYNKSVLSSVYNVTGMADAAKRAGAALNTDASAERVKSCGEKTSYFDVTKPTAQADVIVNLCRLKTHAMCEMSAAVKNMFGSIPGLQKAEMHARFPRREDFAKMLVDLCDTVAPQVNIVDAIACMEGNGPAGGTVKNVGLILGSGNPFALDTVCSYLMGYEAAEVATVAEAIKRGFSPVNVENINIVGEDVNKYVSQFKRPDGSAGGLVKQMPTIFGGRLQKWLEPRPLIDAKKCVACGECVRCCPVETIEIKDGAAYINPQKCIKCYCCQELCPQHAVDVKRNFFLKF